MKEQIKVLVVDDDKSMVKTICDILRVGGFGIDPAFSGEEALEKVKGESPDCVLMDIKMPGINGVEALRRIKEFLPDLPVVLMSAYATDEQAEEAKKNGALALLTKPIDIQMLLFFLSLLKKEKSILVVDDDPAFCKTLKDILQARGYRVETVSEPEKVLEEMEREYKQVVVLDLKLGNVDGVDVLKNIRAKYPTKPVVLVTGYKVEMAASIQNGLRMGVFACLYKPFAMDELIGIIEEIGRKKLHALLGDSF
jgi:two-component system, NtrC family, response regulator HydG